METFWSRVKKLGPNECWEWQGPARKGAGYGSAYFQGKTWTAHRVAYFLQHGTTGPGAVIAHLCNNPRCCNTAHLVSVSQKENIKHRQQAGNCKNLFKNGSEHWNNKLSEIQKIEIKTKLTQGIQGITLAQQYGVNKSCISKIKHGSGGGQP